MFLILILDKFMLGERTESLTTSRTLSWDDNIHAERTGYDRVTTQILKAMEDQSDQLYRFTFCIRSAEVIIDRRLEDSR